MPKRKMKIPTYQQTHPPELATIEALETAGLQPAEGQLVAALFRFRGPNMERTSALYATADAVPFKVKEPK
ncbi:hypothetical protein [Deinococcus sp. QL22]|uniref:hypothetical protein n=1 Tax=Deinococcus sp. QL22 TaxID=2939437 RepID=UPI0020170158|nr:hypothetical protein [Deinococcus sp. QL22]UQN10404.1 hypothetical protein M1R55_30080 [Deinococcus sp. QL22]UQN10538.1 hypothetical protein M1R55_29405 [Deinococcus sp. QL22]